VIRVDSCAFVVIIGCPIMSDERIEKTKAAVDAAGHIPADQKAALSAALSKLKPALAQISQTHQEDAESIARLVEASAREATRQEKRPEHLNTHLDSLKQSVEKFEASHPQLTAFVTEYSAILSAFGI
jgi:prefoldin subunit 5